MSSNAVKNASKGKFATTEGGASAALTGFGEMSAAMMTLQEFSEFQIDKPAEDFISLTKDDITLICLGSDLWNDEKRLQPFLDNLHRPELTLACVGTVEQLAHLPLACHDAEMQTLCLPITAPHLLHQVRNFFQMQRMIWTAERTRQLVEETNESVKYIMRVSRELNGVRDTNKLLSLILSKAREITNADAGSIYTVEWKNIEKREGSIHFRITQNESVPQNLSQFQVPISDHSIVGNAVIHEKPINIPDLYKLDPAPEKNPFHARHDSTWDQKIGYQCRSMLTLPMFDISYRVIGVIQLINRKKKGVKALQSIEDFDTLVLPFDDGSIEYAEIVAHQAGIALENALLTEEKEQLFEGFVHAAVGAIEQRDPTTSGHSHRVARLTVETARMLDRVSSGPYATLTFNDDQLKEIEYASLLHDFGKLGVREEVLVKSKKLYPWQEDLIRERFEHVRSRFEIEYLRDMIKYLKAPNLYPPGFGPESLKATRDRRLMEIEEFLAFISKANEPTVLEQGGFERLKDIANVQFRTAHEETRSLLLDNELKALSVSRGSLTREEFAEIQSHVVHTYEFLRKIPWGSKFANVPQIAAKHHEKLDGSGYPTAAMAEEIPVQSRIMTIADIFDALTASDRPYKKAVPSEKALDIIEVEVKAGRCDVEVFRIFKESQVYKSVLGQGDDFP